MNAKRYAGAIAGGLAAGAAITALLVAGKRKNDRPSELVMLERTSFARLGHETSREDALPSAREQVVVQGGHLLLSAAAGAVYASVVEEDAAVLSSGLAFGAAFYAAMHWIVGPLLGAKAPEWRAGSAMIAMHTLNHLLFGVATATGAALAGDREDIRWI